MTVLLDEGPHRHLHFQKPGTGMYWFEVVTWPGTLTIRGDMGTFVFARLPDMFEFFRGQRVNPMYWAEKEQSRTDVKAYDPDRAQLRALERLEDLDQPAAEQVQLRRALQEQVFETEEWMHHDGAHMLLRDFQFGWSDGSSFEFCDSWEMDLREYSVFFLWCCSAIVSAIEQYDAAHAGAAVSAS